MKTIAEKMEKHQNANRMRTIAHKHLNELEQNLNHAFDFSPHKVAYYKERIMQHKSNFSKYLC